MPSSAVWGATDAADALPSTIVLVDASNLIRLGSGTVLLGLAVTCKIWVFVASPVEIVRLIGVLTAAAAFALTAASKKNNCC